MKTLFIKVLVLTFMFSSLVGYSGEVFASEVNVEEEVSNDIVETFESDIEQINTDIEHQVNVKDNQNDKVIYEVNVEEELGIQNDNFEMIVEENSDHEMVVNSVLEAGNTTFGSELFVNIETGEFYVTEQEFLENGEVKERTYDIFISEIEGEDFKAHLIDRDSGELYEVNTIDANASAIPVLGLIIAQGVKWAVKKYGKKALISAFGKAALSNAIKKVANFSVSKKHLSNAGGRYTKFNTTSQSTVRSWVKQALQSKPTINFNENYSKLSFTITANVGKKIGTKGETKIKVVFDYTGKVWTAYPAK